MKIINQKLSIKKEILFKLAIAVGLLILFLPIVLFYKYSSTSAFILDKDLRLAQYLAANDVSVGKIKDENSYEQIYYTFENNDTIVSDSRFAKSQPNTDNEHIVWSEERNGVWQIFLYHIPTDNLIQLTRTGNNINPKLDSGNIVWQGWVESAQNPDGSSGNWQIFVFDGKVVRQISQGVLAESPDIESDFVIYSQRYKEGSKVYGYSIKADKLQEVTPEFVQGTLTYLEDGEIYYGKEINESEKYAKKINDLFLLEIPLESEPGMPEEITSDNMRDYLEKLIQDAETLKSLNEVNVQAE